MHGMPGIGGFIHEIICWHDISKKSDVCDQMHGKLEWGGALMMGNFKLWVPL
jgi:hypothetical protein